MLAVALVTVARYDGRSVLLAALVSIWSIRLGTFLARRIIAAGSDSRFDSIKTDPLRLLSTWTLQGLWVLLTMAAALAAITADREAAFDWGVPVGAAIWAVGFSLEVVADRQKQEFRSDPANDGRFIRTGLWAWSRHPNYFGEILLWTGIAVISVGALGGWAHLSLVSPLFVYVLLARIRGVPLLERSGQKRWGEDPEYRRYVADTPSLFPRPPHKAPQR